MAKNYRADTVQADIAEPRTLDTIEPGTSVRVCSLENQNESLCRKLTAMGFISGGVVKVVGRAPLGDPISIATLGYTLALRLAEASQVNVVSL